MQEVSNDYNNINNRINELIEQLEVLNETMMAAFVQLSRVYDILATQYYNEHGEKAESLLNMHEEGHIFSTAPVLKSFGEPEHESDSKGH